MKIQRHSKAYAMACERIPQVVAELCQEYLGASLQYFRQEVRCYTPSGFCFSRDLHTIDEDDLVDHIKKAKKRPDCSITISDTVITVRRDLRNGDYYIAEYTPITA